MGTTGDAWEARSGMRAVDVLSTRELFGLEVVAEGAGVVTKALTQALDAGEQCDVAFLNAHAVNVAARDPEFARALGRCLLLNDGVGIDVASRWVHREPFPENLNGTDFVPGFLAAVERPLRLYLLGGRPGVAEAAAQTLARVAPQHTVVGTAHGFFEQDAADGVVRAVASARADVLLVAMGNPVQEKFVDRHRDALGVPVTFSVGALLDFLGGRVERAPGWLRGARSEWVWRLVQEPRRMWRRYLVGNVVFLLRVVRQSRTVVASRRD